MRNFLFVMVALLSFGSAPVFAKDHAAKKVKCACTEECMKNCKEGKAEGCTCTACDCKDGHKSGAKCDKCDHHHGKGHGH